MSIRSNQAQPVTAKVEISLELLPKPVIKVFLLVVSCALSFMSLLQPMLLRSQRTSPQFSTAVRVTLDGDLAKFNCMSRRLVQLLMLEKKYPCAR